MLEAKIIVGDNRKTLRELADKCVQTVVTSPPYWGLRDYGVGEQIGLEQTPDDYVEQLCLVFDEVWRVLKDDGTLWLNLGDTYCTIPHGAKGVNAPQSFQHKGSQNRGQERSGKATVADAGYANRKPLPGLKHKDLVGIPWRVAFALQARGWYLRQDIIWAKPNPMPESVTDRCTKSHEYLFLLTKSPKYFFDNQAIREEAHDGKRNKRDVWTVTTSRYKEAHFATYPPELILPCILAGSGVGDLVLDPFSGSGTTGEVALLNNRNYVGLELNTDYALLSEKRLHDAAGLFATVNVINVSSCD
jgi:site-specific DNA-methyltransferase (cytosine-N4-specific)